MYHACSNGCLKRSVKLVKAPAAPNITCKQLQRMHADILIEHSHWTFPWTMTWFKTAKNMPIASAVCICVGSDYVWGAWQHFFLHFPVVQSARRNANSGNCTGTGLCCSHTVTILILTVWQLQQSFRTQRASAEVCVCVDMDTNKSLNFDVSLSMLVLFFWIYWETKRAERLEDWEVVTSLSV